MRFSPTVHNIGNLRVVLVPEDRESVTVRVMVGSGSKEETDKEAGAAHFLEHYVFKGTKSFPGMFDINDAIEKVGGAFNAYTGLDEMGFWVKMDKNNLELATKIVASVVSEPLLPKEHFDKERGTILEEYYMYEDRPNTKAAQECEKLIFGKTPMGRPVIGTVESLKRMTIEDLRGYFDKWFVAENMIVGIVGDYGSEKEALDLVKRYFGEIIKKDGAVPSKYLFDWPSTAEYSSCLVKRDVEQAAVYLGFRGITMVDERRFALELLNIIYGDGWMSRLMREVREERGWAYAIRSGADQYPDAGAMVVGAGLPKKKLREAVSLIYEISVGLCRGGKWQITEEELEMAKSCFRGRLALEMDRPENVLGDALLDLMYRGKIDSPEEILEKIEKVKLEEVWSLAGEIFKKENMSVAVVGNYDELNFDF